MQSKPLPKTRLSLFYLAGYLGICGFGLLANPQFVMKLFFATGTYHDLTLRLMGMCLIGLFLVVVSLIVKRAYSLYFVTLIVRVWMISCVTAFYGIYRDPFLLVMLIIIGIGFLLSIFGYVVDGKSHNKAGVALDSDGIRRVSDPNL